MERIPARFYKSDSGSEPVRDWLKSLPAADRKKIGEDIRTVQIGWPMGMPLVRKMEKNLWEMRSHINDGIARVFFTIKSQLIVLLHAFVKKSAASPKKDLELARGRMKEVQNG